MKKARQIAYPIIILAVAILVIVIVGLSRRTQKHLEDRLEAYAHAVDYKFETPEEIYPFLTEEFKSKMSKDEFVDAFNKERSYPYITGLYFYDPVVQDGSTDECGTVVYTQAARLPGMTYTIKYKFENGDYYIDDWEDFLDGSYLDKFQNTPYTLDWYYDPDNNTK